MSEGNFEAKKYALRQARDGVIISFVVQPDDFSSALAMVPIGARMMIGWAQIGDDEKRIGNDEKDIEDDDGPVEPSPMMVKAAKLHKEMRTPFASLPLVQQCAMRTDDEEFQQFLVVTVRGKLNWREWEGRTYAEVVRHLLGVKSRTELATNDAAANIWRKLNAEFEAWQTDQRHAGSRR